MRDESVCERNFSHQYNMSGMDIGCSSGSTLTHLKIDDLNSTYLESIELLVVSTINVSRSNMIGPLTIIPSNICRFTKLKV
jgi:hypothetical protein